MKFEKGSLAETRRKLVRGSVAAPLLLTLRPGTAAATSATACIARNAANPPARAAFKIADDNTDQMFRVPVQVWYVKLKSDAGQGNFAKIGNVYYNRTTYLPFANVGGLNVAQEKQVSGEFDYALVSVDPVTGQTTGAAPSAASGNAISMSCWTSLLPRPTTPTV